MAAYLADRLAELDRAGAGVSAITAVTPHTCMLSIVQTGVQAGEVGPDQGDALAKLARTPTQELGVQASVLAGTELALAPAEVWNGVNVVDCARLHIEAIVTAAAPLCVSRPQASFGHEPRNGSPT